MAVLGCRPPVCMLSFFSVVLAYFVVLVHGQSQEGFISIDCGIPDGSGYQNPASKIDFVADTSYIDAGENKKVSSGVEDLAPEYGNVRSFPNGSRNCYTLRPVKPRGKYLIRASFLYGDYDGKNSTPEFDLHVGVNFWTTVRGGIGTEEIITVAPAEYVWVCLVNTGKGTPFISSLLLRPLPVTMYVLASTSQSLVLLEDRWNYGATSQVSYPDDPYDRVWFPSSKGLNTVNTTSTGKVRTRPGDGFEVPPLVLSTAVTSGDLSYQLNVYSGSISLAGPGDKLYVVMHLMEVEQLLPNQTRKMDMYRGEDRGGPLLYGNYSPSYLQADSRDDNTAVGGGGTVTSYSLSLFASASSTRPPMINAFEMFALRQMDGLFTDSSDVDAIQDIKGRYKVRRNWMGDPCAPKEFAWDGVNCSYEASPRIVYLNLTSSGLGGRIPDSIAKLTVLTTLDLSNNNLTGTIPDFLVDLAHLKLLILTGNQLMGTIPQHLCEKAQYRALSLSIEGYSDQCFQETKRKKTFIIVAIVASLIFLVLLIIAILVWRTKREGQSRTSHGIIHITKNFDMAIGRGGFGCVYHGYLNDGTQVAVKVLSQSSSQGIREFQAEALLLTRVHHRNLVTLLGYCDGEHNLALVYEYMDQGTLQDHLSGKIDNINVLSWEQRVKIAIQAAQGLDYLHNGCKPPIIHRDVKSTNILLNHGFVAKLGDFGLSRAFKNENYTHISTGVAGTPGYLDPEYYQTLRLNQRSDVYSFGIVLLEIITGQPPFLNCLETTHIVQWVKSRLESGDIRSIVDARLHGDYDINSSWKVLEIAMSCTSMVSAQRLTMGDVVTQLKECLVPEVACKVFDDSDMHSRNLTKPVPLRMNSGILPSAR